MHFTERTLARRAATGWIGALLLAGCSPPQAPPPTTLPVRPSPTPDPGVRAGAPQTPKSLNELRALAALRIRAANADRHYDGKVPEMLLGIPVLEIELNADGSVRSIEVLRKPSSPEAQDTIKLAADAVRRAAPFGDVSKLPRPWKFTETFLFDRDRKFKLRTLDI